MRRLRSICQLAALIAALVATLLFQSALEIKRAETKTEYPGGLTIDRGESSVMGIPLKNMVVVKEEHASHLPWAYRLLLVAFALELVAIGIEVRDAFVDQRREVNAADSSSGAPTPA